MLTCEEAKKDLSNVLATMIEYDICAVFGGMVRAARDDTEPGRIANCPE